MLPTAAITTPTTLRDACLSLAPEDELENHHPSDLSKADRAILLGRKCGSVSACVKLTSTLASVLDAGAEDEATPNRDRANELLGEVVAWIAKPSRDAEARVEQALLKSSLVTKTLYKGRVGMRGNYEGPLEKACYHTILAVRAEKASDAAAHLVPVAFTTANAIDTASHKPSASSHERLIGIVLAEGGEV